MKKGTKPDDLSELQFAPGFSLAKPADRERLLADLRAVGLTIYRVSGRQFISRGEWQRCLAKVAAVEVA